MTPERLAQLLAHFPSLKIGLVGDLFLDRYLEIDPELSELSIETGLEAYQVTRIRNSPGALGTVMNNLAALGAGRLVPVTVLGDDGQAYDLLKELDRMPVDTAHVLRDAERLTPTYTKPLRRDAAGTWHELNRIDLRNRQPLSRETENRVIERLGQVWQQTDGLIVLDQVNEEGWGVITPAVREALARLATQDPRKLMFVDSRARIAKFTAGTLKPNLSECLRALGQEMNPKEPASTDWQPALDVVGRWSEQTRLRIFCTIGPDGMIVAEPGAPAVRVAGYPVTGPVDTVGAGDSATSGIVCSLLSGARPTEAAAIGNLVASITVTQIGTTGTASPEQLLARCRGAPKL
jgi:rfaE bifunctional protein kinase chain/domain